MPVDELPFLRTTAIQAFSWASALAMSSHILSKWLVMGAAVGVHMLLCVLHCIAGFLRSAMQWVFVVDAPWMHPLAC